MTEIGIHEANTNLSRLLKRVAESFNCHESLLWEGFVTPIYVNRRAHLFPIMRSENPKLNGSERVENGESFSITNRGRVVAIMGPPCDVVQVPTQNAFHHVGWVERNLKNRTC